MNQAEVRTSLVDAFAFKGFAEPMPVYRIEQTYRTHLITGQYIVFTDLGGFSTLVETSPRAAVEKLLNRLYELVGRVCREFGGINRFEAGDSYCLTFQDPGRAMAAVECLAAEWGAFAPREGIRCPMNVAVHKGQLYAFRSFLFSSDLNIVLDVESATRRMLPVDTSIFVTGQARRDLVGTPWDERLHPVDVRPTLPRLAEIEIYRLL